MTLKTISFKPIEIPGLLEHASQFTKEGHIVSDENNFTCLSIDDNFIHALYPYFQQLNPHIEKPDYFGEDLAGAHITVIYPEESALICEEDIGTSHQFTILNAFSADFGLKRYFGLLVKAPSLLDLRRRYGLGKKLQFKNCLVDLHITIGTILPS